MKEEYDEIMYEESTTDRQLHVLNETFINFFGKGTNGKAGPSSTISINTNTVVNYVGQENIPLQHALNLQTQGQNVPNVDVGIRLTIVVCNVHSVLDLGIPKKRVGRKLQKVSLPLQISWKFWLMMKKPIWHN
jgi:hypothetical protein